MQSCERLWDHAFSDVTFNQVSKRRLSPDGKRFEITVAPDGKNSFPWAKLADGDFFTVEIGNKSEDSMRTGFRQAALRGDFEISVVKFNTGSEEFPIWAFRVTRVVGCTRIARLISRASGIDIPVHDANFRRRRLTGYKKGIHIVEQGETPNNRPDLSHLHPIPEPEAPEYEPTPVLAGQTPQPEMGTREKFLEAQRLAREELERDDIDLTQYGDDK